jgi:hypothetical protein
VATVTRQCPDERMLASAAPNDQYSHAKRGYNRQVAIWEIPTNFVDVQACYA